MIRLSELKLPLSALPVEARRAADAPTETEADRAPPPHPVAALRALAAQALGLADGDLAGLQVFKRSFDARKAELLAVYIVDVTLADPAHEAALLARFAQHPHIQPTPDMAWHAPAHAPAGWPADEAERPVVVGFGPCGIFAALALAQMGLKPIVLERGRPVRQRTKDTWGLWRKQVLTPESNVQFGEGGAGLFSDGKLYSQIKDPRFLGRKVMQEFVAAGAPPEILYMAHPHIGTFKLVKVVEALREQITALGGEIRFQQRVTGVLLDDTPGAPAPEGWAPKRLRGLRVQDLATGTEHELPCQQVVLALGHSSRDTFATLHDAGVYLEPKPFSIGVRIEHPQSVIDRARWGKHAGHPLLGAADYKLVHHAANGRAVYSFCMCPGGTVVAATSEPGRVVTNGMSQYSRNERNANAGMVVGIDPPDYPLDAAAWTAAFGDAAGPRYAAQAQALHAQGRTHPLAGVVYQRQLESRAFEAGGRNYEAPGQLVGDFLAARPSVQFGGVQPSYQPGVKLGDLAQVLPDYAVQAMREALPAFGRKIRGYDMADAVMTGVETRTSSPLRITRGDDFQSLNVRGLYPAGEGAGYAGGILSAGVDGLKVAEAVARAALEVPTPA
ncbi:NAD(P)/FAD-dependent oxidoreductase [Aquabacterium sp. A08]|uniref:NAD(P)/FAD-dependent oxidoreductase n=1 Tax=Aquabacterium sp. A08 TaxID=2718532 RepID=UPI0014211373|nr:FAD-dependent oxidoreductase [Aquabacterium sp. A08]NIC42586.1 FAD-dependent oxidoreductase [Aquabacterium sp. A08]